MILRVAAAEFGTPWRLRLTFNDGSRGEANLETLLEGPVFEPLRDPEFFARGQLDPVCGTVVWPNGADFAPEALRALALEEATAA